MEENEFIENQNIFNLGGFDITSNLSPSGDASRVYQYGDIITLDTLIQNDVLTPLLKPLSQNIETLDLANPRLYTKYSSFVELIRSSLENIIVTYPSSLKISELIVGYSYGDINIIDIRYDENSDTTSFSILTNYLDNPGNIIYMSNVDGVDLYKQLNSTYTKYLFEYNSSQHEILAFTPSSKIKNDKIRITVNGKPFSDETNKKISGYLTPSSLLMTEYLSQVSFFERYILRDSFTIINTIEEDGGNEYEYRLKFSLPKIDKYNYDFRTSKYERFLNNLLEVALKYDETYLNVTSRKLIPQSFQDISISSEKIPTYGKANQLLNIYSAYFDELYGNINALKYYDQININNNSYDSKDRLIRFASTLGFSLDSDEMINSIAISELKPLVKNISHLLNSKGTRSGILSVLNYLNIPDELIEFNEKIYTTNKIDYEVLSYYYDTINGETLTNTPVDNKGFPDLSKNNQIFHSNGYFNNLKNLLPAIEDNFFSKTNINQYSDVLVDIDFNLSGDTLNYSLYNLNWSELACYSFTGGTVNNPLPETFFDNCNCKIPLDDISLQICTTPTNPYDVYCPPMVVDVVPNCVAIPQTGSTLSGDTACDFNLTFYSSEGVQNELIPTTSIPTNYISFPYTLSLTSCNSNDNEDYILEQQVTPVHYYNNHFALLSEGGYVASIRLYDTISEIAQDINLNPFTTPYLSGCAGTLTTSNLLFPSGTTQVELNTWASNLEILIENAICTVYSGLPVMPVNNSTYFMSVEAFADGSFNINFNNKNNPITPQYNIGINKNDSNFSLFDGISNHNSNSYFLTFDNLNINFTGDTICGVLTIDKTISQTDMYTYVNTNYNEIEFNVPEPHISTIDNGSVQGRTCLIGGNLTGDTYNYGAYLHINVYGGIPPYSFTGITQGQFFNSGDTYSFYVGDSGCNILHVTGDVICNEDLCLGNQVSSKTIKVTEVQEVETELECPEINIYHILSISANGQAGSISQYDYNIDFDSFSLLDDPVYSISITTEENVYEYTGNTSSFSTTIEYIPSSERQSFSVRINLTDNNCVYFQKFTGFHVEYDLVEEDEAFDVLVAPPYVVITEQEVLVDKIVYEIIPNTPILSASYECNENGTAILNVNISGGTAPYVYYGGENGQIVNDGTTLSIYVEDANGCKSNTVNLNVECGAEDVECSSVNFEASLETTSLDNINETATLTFTYNITGLAFDESIEEVNLVVSGIGNTNNYILGSPIMKNFTNAFGAEQIYLDFTPNNLTSGTYKFFIVVKTENCTYSDIFEMSVDASILSDVDNYTNILE